jgi:hypothetical protein
MKINRKKIGLIVVTTFLISIICFGVQTSFSSASPKKPVDTLESAANLQTSAPAVSILVYTQYADDSRELPNTMQAINDSYGTDYYYEDLTDYTSLNTNLTGHNILLIPEQEGAADSQLKIIGNAWAGNLSIFINNGGIVILLDHNGGDGGTYHIYNTSGLMDIDGAMDITGVNVSLVEGNDPLAINVSSSFFAPNGAVSYNTTETTAVVDDGINPMVVHTVSGKGHIVLLGFDFYDFESNSSTILGNAIRLAIPRGGDGGGTISFGGYFLIFALISIFSLVAYQKRRK